MRERAVQYGAHHRQALWRLTGLFVLLGAPSGASGQDGGMVDGGSFVADGGTAGDAGAASSPDACRCEQRKNAVNRLLHTCVGGVSTRVCASLCAEGGREDVACDRAEPVRACCDMGESYAYLYWDCSHPNCKDGFYEQCRTYGGALVELGDDVPPDSVCAFTVTSGSTESAPEIFPPSEADEPAACALTYASRPVPFIASWLGSLFALLAVRRARV